MLWVRCCFVVIQLLYISWLLSLGVKNLLCGNSRLKLQRKSLFEAAQLKTHEKLVGKNLLQPSFAAWFFNIEAELTMENEVSSAQGIVVEMFEREREFIWNF